MGAQRYTCPVPFCPYEAVQNESPGYFYTAPRCPRHPSHYGPPAMIKKIEPRRLSEHASGTVFDFNVGPPKSFTLDDLRAMRDRINADVAKLATLTYTPPMHIHVDRQETPMEPRDIIAQFTTHINADAARRNRTPEQEYRDLDVHEGDRVRLTEAMQPTSYGRAYGPRTLVKDGSALEGKVIGIKVRGGKTQVRIAGFGHTGPSRAGGQHVWFPVENYKIEVLHKVYRVTDDDRLFIELAGLTEARWADLTDQQRADRRERYAVRADKIRKLLTK